MKSKFSLKHFLIILAAITTVITVGFSAWTGGIFIRDTGVEVRIDKNVRVMSVTPYQTGDENGGISNAEDYDVDKLYADITLPNANSTVSYEIKAVRLAWQLFLLIFIHLNRSV